VDVLVRVAEGSLPEAHVAGGDVQVAGVAAEALCRRGFDVGEYAVGPRVPALQHGDAGPDIAHGQDEVEVAVLLLDHGLAALDADPVTVAEHDLLYRVVEPGVHEDRAPLLLECLLGDPR